MCQKTSHHSYLRNMDSIWLPVEDRRVIIHVSDLDVYCVFHHLRDGGEGNTFVKLFTKTSSAH